MLQLKSSAPSPKVITLMPSVAAVAAVAAMDGKAAIAAVAGKAAVTVTVRPATVFEVDLASARVGKMIAGLIQSRENAALAADILGSEFVGGDFTSPEWFNAAAGCLLRIELASLCVSEWSGFVDDAGQIIEKPSRTTLALLLRSTAAAPLIENAIRADVNLEVAEKNASAASPNGAAAAAEATAGNVISPASDVPQAL